MRRKGAALTPVNAELLRAEAFRSIVSDTRAAIVVAWERAETLQERESAHAELRALKRVEQIINARLNELTRG
jgi:tRNA(Arg) A34 adenosine deaminase TadA